MSDRKAQRNGKKFDFKHAGLDAKFPEVCRADHCCSVDAIVSVDDRGQMVLPKEVRDNAGIKPGDKLAVISMKERNELCCISLIKVDNISVMVQEFLGPFMREMFIGKSENKKLNLRRLK